jgi:hypothetical protein
MPKLSESHAAAIRACVALLRTFEPERSAAECRDLMHIAIKNAMDATGVPKEGRPNVEDLLECYELRGVEA